MSAEVKPPSGSGTFALLLAMIALMRTCGPTPATKSELRYEEWDRQRVERRVDDLERKVRALETRRP